MTKELQKYKESIEYFAKHRIGDIAFNRGRSHAIIMFSQFFQTAKEIVRLFTIDLSGCVFNNPEVLENLIEYFDRGGKIHIVLEKDIAETEPIFDILKEFKKNVTISKTELRPKIGEETEINFCAVDDSIYRLETDKESMAAHISFNDKKQTKELIRVFDKIEKHEKTLYISL